VREVELSDRSLERSDSARSSGVGDLLAGGELGPKSRAGTVGAVPAQPELEDDRFAVSYCDGALPDHAPSLR
jgi:hypothetical protein